MSRHYHVAVQSFKKKSHEKFFANQSRSSHDFFSRARKKSFYMFFCEQIKIQGYFLSQLYREEII